MREVPPPQKAIVFGWKMNIAVFFVLPEPGLWPGTGQLPGQVFPGEPGAA